MDPAAFGSLPLGPVGVLGPMVRGVRLGAGAVGAFNVVLPLPPWDCSPTAPGAVIGAALGARSPFCPAPPLPCSRCIPPPARGAGCTGFFGPEFMAVER